jgi:hypothetical protein
VGEGNHDLHHGLPREDYTSSTFKHWLHKNYDKVKAPCLKDLINYMDAMEQSNQVK